MPSESSSSAIEGVMPKPPALFSPFAIARSTCVFGDEMAQMFGDNAPAAGGKDVADEKDIHSDGKEGKCSVPGESFRPTSVIDP